MNVAFVLPAPVRVPMGGAAVVFRHAAGLVERGHAVTVVAPRRAPGVWHRLRRAAVLVRDTVHGVLAERPGETSGIEVAEPATLVAFDLSCFDAVIATGHQTAPWVHSANHPNPFYFIQGDERALSPRAEATWALPLRRFSVARWIAAVLLEAGHPVEGIVPNAVDPAEMYPTHDATGRPRRVIALYHRHPVKGPEVLIETLDRLRAEFPDVQATILAARPPSHRLPDWAGVHVRPSRGRLRELYGEAAVCLHTSVREGWGLVPMEAAACGCAVAATASLGPREFLEPGRSMLEVPVGDSAALAAVTARLLRDPAERARLSEAAAADVTRFSWDDATDRLERILTSPRPT